MPANPKPKVTIIGTGNVGSTLAALLFEAGYKVVSVIGLDGKSALSLAKFVKCQKVSTSLADIAPESEIIIISIPDGSVAQVAKQIASSTHLRLKKLLVLHTSGVHSAEILKPLAKKGALTGSIHPVQTFPSHRTLTQRKNSTKEIFYGIDGEPKTLQRIEQILRDINGKPLVIDAALRPLYHLACVFSSGYLMVLLNAIHEIALHVNLKGSWTEVFGPLMTTSMQNTIRNGVKNALTGPIIRKDLSTISVHLESLRENAPQFLPLYMAAGIETARLARSGDKLSDEDYSEIIDMFRSFMKTISSTTSLKVKR